MSGRRRHSAVLILTESSILGLLMLILNTFVAKQIVFSLLNLTRVDGLSYSGCAQCAAYTRFELSMQAAEN